MASFSMAQCSRLVDDFWRRGTANCPLDGKRIEAYYHSHEVGYLLVLACSGCGRKAQITRYSDPLRNRFRPWSKAEAARLTTEHRMGHRAACPVCGVATQCGAGELGQVMECPRCGNFRLVDKHAERRNVLEEAAQG
jgi:hypothetical protein